MRIASRKFSDWPAEARRILLALTMRDGSMRYEVQEETRTWVAFEKKEIVGWGIASQYYDHGKVAMVYVRRSQRRQGIGASLLREIRRDTRRRLYAIPHDVPSFKFFEGLKVTTSPVRTKDIRYKILLGKIKEK